MKRLKRGIDALKNNRKKGAALMIAVIIMLLLTMLSLLLLTVSYSLHQTAYRQRNMEQCKEIAQGLSKELQAELCSVSSTISVDEVKNILGESLEKEYPLWSYLRCNLWQQDWPYYNADETKHQFDMACRYFTLDYENENPDEEIPGDVTVAMYWESDKESTKDAGADVPFYIQVTCQIGKQKSTITSEFELHIETGEKGYSVSEEDWTYTPSGPCNPNGHTINLAEKWYFTESTRE